MILFLIWLYEGFVWDSGNVDSGTSPDLSDKVGSQNTITEHNESTIAYLPNPGFTLGKNRIV